MASAGTNMDQQWTERFVSSLSSLSTSSVYMCIYKYALKGYSRNTVALYSPIHIPNHFHIFCLPPYFQSLEMHIVAPSIGVLVLSIVTSRCHATLYTYWVDESCSSRPDWDEYLKEALTMAAKANARIQSATDSDYANVFQKVFNTPKTDAAALQTVTGITMEIVIWIDV